MLKLTQKLIILSVLALLIFSGLICAKRSLFHLDYAKFENAARDYIQLKHPEYKPSEIKLDSVNVNFNTEKKFRNISVSFSHKTRLFVKLKLVADRKYKLFRIRENNISLSIAPNGKVNEYSEGPGTLSLERTRI